eukprot:2953997-Rhodomonas_salina.1
MSRTDMHEARYCYGRLLRIVRYCRSAKAGTDVAMAGTDIAMAGTGIVGCYEVAGTGIAGRYQMSGTEAAHAHYAISSYACMRRVSGTKGGVCCYQARPCRTPYALPATASWYRCVPMLLRRIQYSP